MRALVVDDQVLLRMYVRRLLLEYCGFSEVYEAMDGADALHSLGRTEFDLVILDMGLPGANGFSLVKSIRELRPEQRFIILSGYPARDFAEKACSYGAFAYLEKSCTMSEIASAVLEAVSGREHGPAAAAGS